MNYCFFVEYVEKLSGDRCSDIWDEELLLKEIRKGDVEIIGIMPTEPPTIYIP